VQIASSGVQPAEVAQLLVTHCLYSLIRYLL
jgi:hypothetical protein